MYKIIVMLMLIAPLSLMATGSDEETYETSEYIYDGTQFIAKTLWLQRQCEEKEKEDEELLEEIIVGDDSYFSGENKKTNNLKSKKEKRPDTA